MKFFLDNNLPISLAKAINELGKPKGFEVVHLREMFDGNAKDVFWLGELKKQGNWAIISHDRFGKSDLEKEALYRSDIIAFILLKGWSELEYWIKAKHLVSIFPTLIKQTEIVSRGAFGVPVTGHKLIPIIKV